MIRSGRAPFPTPTTFMAEAVGKIHKGPIGTALINDHLLGIEMKRRLHRSDHRQGFSGTLMLKHLLSDASYRLLPQLISKLRNRDECREVKQKQRGLHRQQPLHWASPPGDEANQYGSKNTDGRPVDQTTAEKIHGKARHLRIANGRNPQARLPEPEGQTSEHQQRAAPGQGYRSGPPSESQSD